MMDKENDQRRHPRHNIPLEGTLHSRGEAIPCQVRNISATGALVKVEASLRPGHFVSLELPELGKMGGRVVRLIWKHAGISLEEGEAKIEGFIVEWLDNQSKET